MHRIWERVNWTESGSEIRIGAIKPASFPSFLLVETDGTGKICVGPHRIRLAEGEESGQRHVTHRSTKNNDAAWRSPERSSPTGTTNFDLFGFLAELVDEVGIRGRVKDLRKLSAVIIHQTDTIDHDIIHVPIVALVHQPIVHGNFRLPGQDLGAHLGILFRPLVEVLHPLTGIGFHPIGIGVE